MPPKFNKQHEFKNTGVVAHGKQVWFSKFNCENASRADVKTFVESKIERLKQLYPDAHFNVPIQYKYGVRHLVSKGFRTLDEEVQLGDPYELDGANDEVDYFLIQITRN